MGAGALLLCEDQNMALGSTPERAKENLRSVIKDVAHDIETYGADALWHDTTQMVTGGKIVVTIDAQQRATIEYIRNVII